MFSLDNLALGFNAGAFFMLEQFAIGCVSAAKKKCPMPKASSHWRRSGSHGRRPGHGLLRGRQAIKNFFDDVLRQLGDIRCDPSRTIPTLPMRCSKNSAMS
jgi:hypothetical protein